MIYLDHNATTNYSPLVQEYIKNNLIKDWANSSSVHDMGYDIKSKLEKDRKLIADILSCYPKNLIFVGSATEAINTVLSVENFKLNKFKTLITSKLEHSATLKKAKYLQTQNISILYVENNKNGEINLQDLNNLCKKNPDSLLSFLSVNNETGVVTDIESISKIAKQFNCSLHLDAVQHLGKLSLNLETLNIDFASFSGHKIGALKGCGLLYTSKPLAPLLYGGQQERGLRPGTCNYAANHSFRLALEDLSIDKINYISNLKNYFEKNFLNLDKNFKINCYQTRRVGNTSNIYLAGLSAKSAFLYLSQQGFCVSTGSACNSTSEEPSHVLINLGYTKNYARSCLRISFGFENSLEEIDLLLKSLKFFLSMQKNLSYSTQLTG